MRLTKQFLRSLGASHSKIFKDSNDKVIFNLHTKTKPEGEIIKVGDVEGLQKSNFDSKRPTKIVTHGYASSSKSPSCVLPTKGITSIFASESQN